MLTKEKIQEMKVSTDTKCLVKDYEYVQQRIGKDNALPLLQILYAYKTARERR